MKKKYSLYKVLLNDNNILSHVFLNCLPSGLAEKIAAENETMEKEDIEKREIEIELKIAGESVDPGKFFKRLENQYDELLKEAATHILKEQTSEKFQEISYKLNEFEEIINSWAEEINWDVKNPFKK